jgi:hypothetical protein
MPGARSRFTGAGPAGSSIVDPRHFAGVVDSGPRAPAQIAPVSDTVAPPQLLRPLLEYERLVGGRYSR